jgi:heme exporter protein A
MPADASRAECVLEARGVSKFFRDFAALKEVSLRAVPGDAVLIYGPNGAGKTTLLRILAGLSRPSHGCVLFGNESVHASSRAKHATGFVSHATFLYSALTARENLRLAGRLFNVENLEARITAMLETFSLEDHSEKPVRALSRGLQQRVTLARAFLHQPRWLILDEPFTGLDAASSACLEALLRNLRNEDKGLVFSTHQFEQGASIAMRLIVLERGRIRYDGPAAGAPAPDAGEPGQSRAPEIQPP